MKNDPTNQEARALLKYYGDFQKCFDHLSNTFSVISQRTQMMLSLGTLTLTITGFSGPKIANSNIISRYAMILGLILVLASLLINVWGVLRIRWTNNFLQEDAVKTLSSIIHYRQVKTAFFVKGSIFLVLGLTFYVLSVVAYLCYGM